MVAGQVESTDSAKEQVKPFEWMIGDWVGEYTAVMDDGQIKKGDLITVNWSVKWLMGKHFDDESRHPCQTQAFNAAAPNSILSG